MYYDWTDRLAVGLIVSVFVGLLAFLGWAGWTHYKYTQRVCVETREEVVTPCLHSRYKEGCLKWGAPRPEQVCVRWEQP